MIAQPFDDNDNDVAAPGEWLEPVRSECGPHSTPVAAGTVVNLPIEPGTMDATWLESIERIVPELATAFAMLSLSYVMKK